MRVDMEAVARALLLTVRDNAAAALAEVAAEKVSEDTDFYAALGVPVPVTPLTVPVTIKAGYHFSMLERPESEYPILVVMCHSAGRNDTEADQYDVPIYELYVEIMLSHRDPDTVGRMAWRWASALEKIIDMDDTLGNMVEQVSGVPEIAVSSLVSRKIDRNSTTNHFLQGARMDLNLRVPTAAIRGG